MSRLLLLLLLACQVDAEGAPPDAEAEDAGPQVDPRTLVDAVTVTRGSVADRIVASAAVDSEVRASVIPEASGVVTRLNVEEGDTVSAGQLLAELASPTLDGAWQRASAEVERTKQDLVVAERLYGSGALSQAELEASRRAARAAELALAEASRTRGFTRLRSPIAGTVATRSIRFGEVAGPSPAFVIMDLSKLRVVVDLPEREVSRVAVGQSVTLSSAWAADQTAAGTVERVSPVVDATTGTFKVTVAIAPGQTALRPGQYASVAIEVDRRESVLTVPVRAVVWEEGRSYVFTVVEDTGDAKTEGEGEKTGETDPDEAPAEPSWWEKLASSGEPEKKAEELPGPKRKVTRLAVELGYRDNTSYEVRSGVNEGDVVVTVGNLALRDGGKVRLPGDPTVEKKKKDEEKAEEKAEGEPKAE